MKDILIIERVQRHATKYILNDFTSCYKTRLLKLNLLPLMYMFELQDLLFTIKYDRISENGSKSHIFIYYCNMNSNLLLLNRINRLCLFPEIIIIIIMNGITFSRHYMEFNAQVINIVQ